MESAMLKSLQDNLCKALCASFQLSAKSKELTEIDTPFLFPDGDPYRVFLKSYPLGGFRLTDLGHTMMHMSNEHDIEKFFEGQRAKIMQQILAESNIKYEIQTGELYQDVNLEYLSESLINYGQAISRIFDLTLFTRTNIENTFMNDLEEVLHSAIKEVDPSIKMIKDYELPDLADSSLYAVDFYLERGNRNLYVFGIQNRDKAKNVTINLLTYHKNNLAIDSLLVFQDLDKIPKKDLAKLMNEGGEMLPALEDNTFLTRKIRHKLVA